MLIRRVHFLCSVVIACIWGFDISRDTVYLKEYTNWCKQPILRWGDTVAITNNSTDTVIIDSIDAVLRTNDSVCIHLCSDSNSMIPVGEMNRLDLQLLVDDGTDPWRFGTMFSRQNDTLFRMRRNVTEQFEPGTYSRSILVPPKDSVLVFASETQAGIAPCQGCRLPSFFCDVQLRLRLYASSGESNWIMLMKSASITSVLHRSVPGFRHLSHSTQMKMFNLLGRELDYGRISHGVYLGVEAFSVQRKAEYLFYNRDKLKIDEKHTKMNIMVR